MKASDIAQLVDGELLGGADPEVDGVAPLDRAGARDLSFLAHPKYLSYVDASGAGALLIGRALVERAPQDRPRIVVKDVHGALAKLLPSLYPPRPRVAGVHPTAVIGRNAVLGERVEVGPYVVVSDGAKLGDRVRLGAHAVVGEGCVLADDVVLHPHVTLYPGVRVGARSILHTGVRAGVDGFGYAWSGDGHRKVPQVGSCVIGADVEIGANTTIDRGSVGATEIGDGVKIDNLVHIAHNVRIGAHSLVIAQVGIAGSTTIGKGVTLAGQAGIPGHLTIGDGATVAAQAGVFGDIPPGAVYSGYPARPHKESLRSQAGLARLPSLLKRIRALEQALFGKESGEA